LVISYRSRRNPQTFQAVKTVMATTELLEQILLHLPMRKILFAQRVSKRFQRVIEGSSGLQQKFFFTPQPDSNISRDTKPVINPLLKKHFRPTTKSVLLMVTDEGAPCVFDINFGKAATYWSANRPKRYFDN